MRLMSFDHTPGPFRAREMFATLRDESSANPRTHVGERRVGAVNGRPVHVIDVTAVRPVRIVEITDDDARLMGSPGWSGEQYVRHLRDLGYDLTDEVTRVDFRYVTAETELELMLVDRARGGTVAHRWELLTFRVGYDPIDSEVVRAYTGPLGGYVAQRRHINGAWRLAVESYTR